VTGEWCVFGHSHTALVIPCLAVDHGLSLTIRVGLGGQVIVLSVKIIPVKVTGEAHSTLSQCLALRTHLCGTHTTEIDGALMFLPLIEQALLDDVETSKRLSERRPGIIAPVSCTVANHSATKVDLRQFIVELGLQIILVDLPGEVGDVDSTI